MSLYDILLFGTEIVIPLLFLIALAYTWIQAVAIRHDQVVIIRKLDYIAKHLIEDKP